MSVEIAWKQNILVTDFHLLKSLLVVLGFGSQAFVCGFSRQNINSVIYLVLLSIIYYFLLGADDKKVKIKALCKLGSFLICILIFQYALVFSKSDLMVGNNFLCAILLFALHVNWASEANLQISYSFSLCFFAS